MLPVAPSLLLLLSCYKFDFFFPFFAIFLSSASKWVETICDPPDSDSFLALPQSSFGIIAGWCLFDSLIVICFDLRLLCLCLGLKQWEIRTLDWGCKRRERTNAFFIVRLLSCRLFLMQNLPILFFFFFLRPTCCAPRAIVEKTLSEERYELKP